MNILKLLYRNIVPIIFVVLALWLILTIFLLYQYYKNSNSLSPQKEAAQLKKSLSKHIDFADIEPSFASVTDAETLKKQDSFYKRVQNGDKILVWEGKAFIYRPQTDRIIDIGIVLSPQSDNPIADQATKANVLILNGSKTDGLAETVKQRLSVNLSTSILNINLKNAAKSDYTNTIIINLKNGKFKTIVENISTLIPGSTIAPNLPENEKADDLTDIVIILGENQK